MAVVTHGSSLPDSSQKTDFYGIVDNATVTSIVAADISASAGIMDTQLNTISTAGKVNTSALTGQIANANLAQIITPALVSGAALTLLPNVPPGAGLLPAANIGGTLGAWITKTPGQIYQALTDGFFVCTCTVGNTTGGNYNVYTDSSSSPSTVRGVATRATGGIVSSVTTPVKKNDYYEVDTGVAAAFFIASGS